MFACGVPTSRCSVCPCELGDRYVVVDAERAGRRWRQCADVLICPPQSDFLAASRAARGALLQVPGCTLAAACHRGLGYVLRSRDDLIVVSGHSMGAALLAAYAYRRNGGGGL